MGGGGRIAGDDLYAVFLSVNFQLKVFPWFFHTFSVTFNGVQTFFFPGLIMQIISVSQILPIPHDITLQDISFINFSVFQFLSSHFLCCTL